MPVDEEIVQSAEHQGGAADPEHDVMHLALGDVGADFYAQPAQHRTPDRRAKQGEQRKPHSSGVQSTASGLKYAHDSELITQQA